MNNSVPGLILHLTFSNLKSSADILLLFSDPETMMIVSTLQVNIITCVVWIISWFNTWIITFLIISCIKSVNHLVHQDIRHYWKWIILNKLNHLIHITWRSYISVMCFSFFFFKIVKTISLIVFITFIRITFIINLRLCCSFCEKVKVVKIFAQSMLGKAKLSWAQNVFD